MSQVVGAYPANAGGGVLVTPGGDPIAATGARLADQYVLEETGWLDPKFCQETSDKTHTQCQAYPVGDTGICAGHTKRLAKQARAENGS